MINDERFANCLFNLTLHVTALRFDFPIRENRAPQLAVIAFGGKTQIRTAQDLGRAPIAANRVRDAGLGSDENGNSIAALRNRDLTYLGPIRTIKRTKRL